MREKVVELHAIFVDILFCLLPCILMDLTMHGEHYWAQRMLILKMCPNFAQSKSLLYGLLFPETCNDLG